MILKEMEISWIKYKKYRAGRDPLGVQAIGIHLYGELVPGITNVTDRLRYYSFYPWVVRIYKEKNMKFDFVEYFRRADFLFGFITKHHHKDDKDWTPHMVGTETINRAKEELDKYSSFRLSNFTDSYFKNELGGLGQYYLGAISKMGILERNSRLDFNLPPQGEALAEAFDSQAGSNKDLFLKCILQDNVTKKNIEDLESSFCACSLKRNTNEYRLLAEYIRDSDDVNVLEKTFNRQKTLALLFALLKQSKGKIGYWDLINYLYYGYDSFGKIISMPKSCEEIAKKWEYYVMHEYFSLGLMGMFIGVQNIIREGTFFKQEIIEKAWKYFISEANIDSPKYVFGFIKTLKKNPTLGAVIQWVKNNTEREASLKNDNFSEFNCEKILEKRNLSAEESFVVGFLLVLFTMTRLKQNYVSKPTGAEFERVMIEHPINLDRLSSDADTWGEKRVSAVISEIIQTYILNSHMAVAVKKLFTEGLSTFRFIREYNKYSSTSLPIDDIRGTSPRLKECLQIMADLKLIQESQEGFIITDEKVGNEYFKGLL